MNVCCPTLGKLTRIFAPWSNPHPLPALPPHGVYTDRCITFARYCKFVILKYWNVYSNKCQTNSTIVFCCHLQENNMLAFICYPTAVLKLQINLVYIGSRSGKCVTRAIVASVAAKFVWELSVEFPLSET